MTRFCDAMFCLTAGAMIAAFVLARMFVMPHLFSAAMWFGLSALAFYAHGWAKRRINGNV